MKKIIIAFTVFISISFTSPGQNSENPVEIFVNVTDFDGNISSGDEVGFISQTTKKIYSKISDENGNFSILLPRGDIYQVTIKSFEGNSNYCAMQVPEDENAKSYSITVMFQLPETYILKKINFDTGKATLQTSSFSTLDNLVELMQNKDSLRIELSGHTDDIGDDSFNLELSQKRAEAVKNYLVKNGISSDRIISVGYGETQPVASNSSEDGRSLNRRTEVKILD